MSWVKNNLVLIVMLPVVAGIHIGWMQMQDQRDRNELPIMSFAKLVTQNQKIIDNYPCYKSIYFKMTHRITGSAAGGGGPPSKE